MTVSEVGIKHKSDDVKLNITLQDYKIKLNELINEVENNRNILNLKNVPWIDVREYGAKVGVDSAPSFQAAANSLSSSGGVMLTRGNYNLANGNITIPDGVTVYGYSNHTLSVNSGRRCFNLGNNCQLLGLNFDGNDDASGNYTSTFIRVKDKAVGLIKDCIFDNLANSGIKINDGSIGWRVIDCDFNDIRQADSIWGISVGVTATGTSETRNVKIIGCNFINADGNSNGSCGIQISGDKDNDLQATDILIDGCYFEYMGRDTSGVRGDIDIYNDVERLTVVNCKSVNSVYRFLKVNDIIDFLADNNTVIDCANSGISADYRYGTTISEGIVITNNTIRNPGAGGISSVNAPTGRTLSITIANNNIYSAGSRGIYVRDAHNVNIHHNTVRSPADDGIEINKTSTDPVFTNYNVSHNIIDMGGIAKFGIHIGEDSDIGGTVCSHNVIYNNTVAAISLFRCREPQVFGNKFANVGFKYFSSVLSSAYRIEVGDGIYLTTYEITDLSGASVDTNITIVGGSEVLCVTSRITTAFGTGNGTSGYQLGDGTTANLWADKNAITLGTNTDMADILAAEINKVHRYTANTDIIITAKGGNFDGTGDIRIELYQRNIDPPSG